MSFENVVDKIRNDFRTDWNTQYPSIPLKEQNRKLVPQTGQPWAAIDILAGESFERTVGPPRQWRHPGATMVRLYVPSNSGTDVLDHYTDFVQEHFRNRRAVNDDSEVIRFIRQHTSDPPMSAESDYYQRSVSADFEWDAFYN
jgi:hypothetical protein